MAKLTNNLFGRRFWAVVIAILMVVQLLPVAAIADYVELTDESGIVVDTVPNKTYDGGVDVDTVTVKEGHDVAPIGQAQTDKGEGVLPIEPIDPNPGDDLGGDEGTEPEAPGKTDDGEGDGQIGGHIADDFDLNRPDETDTTDPEQGETDPEQGEENPVDENPSDDPETPNDGKTDPEQSDGSEDVSYYLVGERFGWDSTDYPMTANPYTEGEYMITLNLEAGDAFKVKDSTGHYYPDLSDNITVSTAGRYTVYCKPGENSVSYQRMWTVTFYNRDAEVHKTIYVSNNTAIGDQFPATIAREDYDAYWAIGEIVQGGQGNEINVIGPRVGADYVVTSDLTVVPDYDKVTYTVTFYADEECSGEPVATKSVTVDTSYCLNDIPAVPSKDGSIGKWVYSGGDFGNTVDVSKKADSDRKLSVWAEYEQNVFTVTYIYTVGEETVTTVTYETDTYYKGDLLTLPAEPVVEGKEFIGWFDEQGTQYNGGEAVNSDLTLIAAFDDEYAVSFVILNDDGTVQERLSQYFRQEGETIGQMPQDPFVAGKVFEKWVLQGTDTEVTAATVVNENMTVVAQFRTIEIFELTVKSYYIANTGAHKDEKIYFNTDIIQIDKEELPYTYTAAASTQTSSSNVVNGPVYYASTPTVEVTLENFQEVDGKKVYETEIQYVAFTAVYDFVYMLKNLTDEGYTEIDRTEDVEGVYGSFVTPTVKTFAYAVLERAVGATITQASGQELYVYYTRKNFSVSYETNGGSYVAGQTAPYGTTITLPTTDPTRTGYTFEGWYSDAELTTRVSGPFELTQDTILYANWTGKTVGYTILYMKEQYHASGNTWVYENSRTANATVGTTVYAANTPAITLNGYEKTTAVNGTATSGGTGADTAVTVAADGSTTLKVYYSLIRYTLVFDINRNDGRITIGGQTYTGSNYRVENVVLGQDVSSMWPATQSEIYDRYNNRYFDGWTGADTTYITKRYELIWDNVKNANNNHVMTFTASWSRDTSNRDAQYWLQQPDGTYKKEDAYTQIGLNTDNLSAKNIEGYTKHSGIPAGYPRSGRYDDNDNWLGYYGKYTYRFYYDRAQYDIIYKFGGTELKREENIFYEADISSAEYNYTPAKPANANGIDYSDYIWGGWYADEKFAQPYTFTTMPGNDLVLYAKWVAPTFTVTFDTDGGTPVPENQTVDKYKMATAPETSPSKTGYTFDGWYTTADGDQLFDWRTQIKADTTVYAHWTRATLSYTVRYLREAGADETSTVTIDGKGYVPLAPDKVVTNPNFEENQVIPENALAIAGYRPDQGSKTVTLSYTGTNEIIFVYGQKSEYVSYTVKYVLEDDPRIEVAPAKVVENIDGNTTSVGCG